MKLTAINPQFLLYLFNRKLQSTFQISVSPRELRLSLTHLTSLINPAGSTSEYMHASNRNHRVFESMDINVTFCVTVVFTGLLCKHLTNRHSLAIWSERCKCEVTAVPKERTVVKENAEMPAGPTLCRVSSATEQPSTHKPSLGIKNGKHGGPQPTEITITKAGTAVFCL